MKQILRAAFAFVLLLTLAAPSAALAAGNTTEVEQKWIDFQKAVTDQMVKDGKLTRQEADARVKEFTTRFAESPGDSIYEFFAEKHGRGGCKDGKCQRKDNQNDTALRVYSMLTGRNAEDIQKTCDSSGQSVWQLARKEGKLDALKSKVVATQSASMDVLVKGGLMTEQQKSGILQKIKEELDKK